MSLALMLGNSLVSPNAATMGGQPELGFLAFVGASSAFYNSLYNVAGNNRQFYGDGVYNHALWRLGGGVTLLRNAADSDAFHFGQSGATATTLLVAGTGRIDLAIAAAEAAYAATGKQTALVCQHILNNIGQLDDVPTMQGYVEDLIDRCEAAGKAVKLFIPKAWPRLQSETDSADKLALRIDVNSMLDTVCAANNVTLLETADVGDDGNGYLLTTWSDAVAPGHGTVPFASRVGNILYQAVAANCRVPEFNLWDYAAYMVDKNVALTGTGGSGGRPTGWSIGNLNSSTQSTWSLVPYGDGSGRNWLRTSVANTLSNGVSSLFWSTNVSTGFAVGDIMEAFVELRFPNPTNFNLGAVYLALNGGTTFINPICGQPRTAQQAPPIGIEYHTDKLVLRTPRTIITSGTSEIGLTLRYTGNADAFDIGTPCMILNGHLAGLPQYYPAS